MSPAPVEVLTSPDRASLAAAVAGRLVTRLVDVQARRGRAGVVLTGGTVGTEALRQVAASPAVRSVDWSRADLWWGDERFLPDGDGERNATQAREALLDALTPLGLDPARVHAMPASDGPDGDDPDAAARRYAQELARVAREAGVPGPVPVFDVLLLGVGPDGHVASLFPGHPGAEEAGEPVVAVRDAPKPPPTRLSLTMPVITTAEEVWCVVSGADKADAAARALAGPGALPASRARGVQRTLWLVDADAAGGLPPA
ncbi:6-phosphogluconolactonase [Quadrisphaera sp. DSM 44207]|uniref:6-phosphogluconolactonase n=1 Tax=Quadrisphaera sp. DSM 44207 TaxID=1881057 RepID=UPI00088D56D8|nr:6-phosphogluconolactonase [Quadrisphaera sp. DSM 44207]SDQ44266.1 6-phosphogluconolactonase [Quadrisphaera sp. DSM 44207]